MFEGYLDVRMPDEGDIRTLLAPLIYVSYNDVKYVIPSGFKTDYASVPKVLWNILPPTGLYTKAAVLHDWLYAEAPGGISRKEADLMFLEAMARLGVTYITRYTMYYGVRIGGRPIWNRYRAAARRLSKAK